MTSLFAIFDRDAIRDFFAKPEPKPDSAVIIRNPVSRYNGLPGMVAQHNPESLYPYQVDVGGELVWFTAKELEVVEAEEIELLPGYDLENEDGH